MKLASETEKREIARVRKPAAGQRLHPLQPLVEGVGMDVQCLCRTRGRLPLVNIAGEGLI